MSLARFFRPLLPDHVQPAARYYVERWRRQLEPEIDFACRTVTAGQRFVDVGASWGIYTYALARSGVEVEAFEPQLACCRILYAYAARHPNVRVHRAALGAGDGSAVLHVPVIEGRLARTSASLAHAATGAGGETLDVDVRTLDSYEFSNVRAMKIDVEGAEVGVLRGAERTIQRHRPLLIIEIEQRHHAEPIDQVLARITGDLGYDGHFLGTGVLRPLRVFDASRHQVVASDARPGARYINNFIFIPRGS